MDDEQVDDCRAVRHGCRSGQRGRLGRLGAACPAVPAQALPSLYVSAMQAQAACPTDQVVWVNWEARTSHLPADKYYGHTKVGAYACATDSSAAGIRPSN